jgi:predicted nucleic acid-binding Zn ribbon protein
METVMHNLFEKTSSGWVKYDKYEWKEDTSGTLFITPTQDAKPSLSFPLKDSEQLVLKAINIGMLCMDKNNTVGTIKNSIMDFVTDYGLLGFMTALPTTPEFITYEAVYFPKNHFIKNESMTTEEYLSYFFPFDDISFMKNGMESLWQITDPSMIALAMTLNNIPQAVSMSFQREYAERYDWLVTLFKDWAFTFISSFLYYQDFDRMDETSRSLYRQGMAAFEGISPTYHIELLDRPTIVWDFHSLLLCVQMMFSFMLTDEKSPLKVCKHCGKAFVAHRPNSVFCSGRCKNQFNVYKSRAKDKDERED